MNAPEILGKIMAPRHTQAVNCTDFSWQRIINKVHPDIAYFGSTVSIGAFEL
ncbi:MAG: hypothetical protein GY710_27260 [Desulfobacteraceae bacterium]|nr:hypothetical protein [Desulfobacteraceae bacterium]